MKTDSTSSPQEIIIVFVLSLSIVGAILFYRDSRNKEEVTFSPAERSDEAESVVEPEAPIRPEIISDFQPPLDRASERVTKKPFGIFIDPKTSPIQPEKFSGYHTGTDFEIFPEESDVDVSIKAVCSGNVIQKRYVNGYGGVVIQNCFLDNNPITVLYGHLKLASVNLAVGDSLKIGDTIGILGKAFSAETSGERKHLHLGFHRGSEINYLGYVPNKNDLSDWIDPCVYVCEK